MSEAGGETRSKVMVVGFVVLIVGGAAAWNAWDYFGTEGLNPKAVKELATNYEVECMESSVERKACKRHIGLRHRECLSAGVVRDPDVPPRYEQSGYSACMRAHRAQDLAGPTVSAAPQ